MAVRVLFFAVARERTGEGEIAIEIRSGESLGGLLDRLCAQYPALAAMRNSSFVAVNQEYAGPATVLCDGDEVAWIPPVSGGAGGSPVEIRIAADPLDERAVAAYVAQPAAGAIVTFAGTVRNSFEGRPVLAVEYEAYLPMAETKLREVAETAASRHGATAVAVHHRVGRLAVGEASVVIAVSAPHRAEAFAACREIIDRLKEVVPIWKREVFSGGAEWR